jgi:hypothetical protein
LLSVYKKYNNKQKHDFKYKINNDFVKFIVEIVASILDGKTAISQSSEANLNKYKNKMRTLLDPHKSLGVKRYTIQTGGFLATILAAIASSVVSSLISKIGSDE